MTRSEKIREILATEIENHKQPCDCLICRRGGRVDHALSLILALNPSEDELAGWIGDWDNKGDNERYMYDVLHNDLARYLKGKWEEK